MHPRHRIALWISLATVFVFFQVERHEFVDYDDLVYIVSNPNLPDGFNLGTIARAFTTPYEANWIPLTWISLQLDYALYGLDPAGYHLTNLALHTLSAVILLLALVRMTGAVWRSGFVAAVFALHPLHVESVAWAAERKDALCGVFFMLTLYAYARYAERPGAAGRYTLVIAGMALSLLAKPVAVILPLVLLLLDFWPLGRLDPASGNALMDRERLRRVLVEKIPLLTLAAGAAAVTLLVQNAAGAIPEISRLPLGLRLSNALDAYRIYLVQSVWPTGLAVFYPHPGDSLATSRVLLGGLLLAGITTGAILLARTRPYLLTGWLWYVGSLAPMIGLVQVGSQAHADRFMYFPLIGLSVMVAWGAVDLAAGKPARQTLVGVVAATVLVALSIATFFQVGIWRDTLTLQSHAVSVLPESYIGHHGVARALQQAGRLEESIFHFQESLRLAEGRVGPHVGLADVYSRQGRLEDAIRHYRRALELDPDNALAHANLGLALIRAERMDEARPHLERTLAIQEELGLPDSPEALRALAAPHIGLADALAKQKKFDAAIAHYERGLELAPRLARARAGGSLGLALMSTGRYREARTYLEPLASRPDATPEIHVGIAITYARLGETERAILYFRMALSKKAAWPPAANELAWLLATTPDESLRNPAEAVRIAELAVQATRRRGAALLDTLAAAYAAGGRFEEAIRTVEEAARVAEERGNAALRDDIRTRLVLYREGRAYVAPDPNEAS